MQRVLWESENSKIVQISQVPLKRVYDTLELFEIST